MNFFHVYLMEFNMAERTWMENEKNIFRKQKNLHKIVLYYVLSVFLTNAS